MNTLKLLARSLRHRFAPSLASRGVASSLDSGFLVEQLLCARQVRSTSMGASTRASGAARPIWPVAPATPRIVLRGVL